LEIRFEFDETWLRGGSKEMNQGADHCGAKDILSVRSRRQNP